MKYRLFFELTSGYVEGGGGMVVEMNEHESVGEYGPLLLINDLSMLLATFVVV
jgi:hypothetical protein